ncbi:MAG TPA: hypothetical protein VFH56_02710 [Acidimicrobiales bacterium]|nr:hypothetical protein [Acidimicrobiales bacterium]
MPLSEREVRLFQGRSYEAQLFREGANAESRAMTEQAGRHLDLVETAQILAANHQELTSGEIALMLARIFNHTIEEEPF